MFGIHFKEAFEGLVKIAQSQRTFQVHLAMSLITIIAAFYFDFSPVEWSILVITISLVLTAEAFNTAIETFADSITIKPNGYIKTLKDMSAGSVLISAIYSVVIGFILFYPKISMLLS